MTECRSCGRDVPVMTGGRVGQARQDRLCDRCWRVYQSERYDLIL